MRLEQHISQLLYEYDCVIVPNFGAFISNVVGATYSKETNTFYPPQKHLSFNSLLKKNDGILVEKVVNHELISQDEAQSFINEQVYFWQEHLSAGKVLRLNNIGSLELNEAGKIDFRPENSHNYFIPAYGLSELKANYVLSSSESKTTNQYMSKLLTVVSIIPIIVGGFLYFNTPQPVENFVKEQWSGLVLPIIDKNSEVKNEENVVAQYDVYNMPQTIYEPSLVEYQIAEMIDDRELEDSINVEVPKKVEITVVEEKKLNDNEKQVTAIIKENKKPKELVKTELKREIKTSSVNNTKEKSESVATNKTGVESKKYQVVAASLRRKEDADRLIKDLKNQGYKDASISYVKGKYYYVLYNSFENMDQAQKYMNDLYKKAPETWVRKDRN